MEKPSYTKQQHSICSSTRNMKQMHDFKVKASSFDYTSNNLGDGDLMAAAGFSWPPRSYICSFCKREFRSAQALGGHMNVHRRDRARLRQSPARDGDGVVPTNNGAHFSLLNLNFQPSPSLCSNPSFSKSSPSLASHLEMRKCGGDAVPAHYRRPITKGLMKVKGFEQFESSACKKGLVSLELGMGLMSPSKEKLDLELRLGYN